MTFQFSEKQFFRVLDTIILVVLGASLAYFASSVVSVLLPFTHPYTTVRSLSGKRKQMNKQLDKLIIAKNIFNVNTGVALTKNVGRVNITRAKVVSNIDGYKLIGYIRGENPMVLLKKGNKPVVIITKKRGLEKRWYLYKISAEGVYLRNKKNGAVKLFKFTKNQESGNVHPAITLINENSINPAYKSLNSNIEKVKISRKMLSKLGGFNSLFRQMSVVPVFKNGKAYGYRINFLSPVSILKKIGLRVGDVIVSVNGEPTTNPSALMGIYSQLKEMNSISINLIRRSKKKTIFVEIK